MGEKRVFLGGTCNESLWRDKLISMLKIGYFNPVVDDWTEECMMEERKQREICDFCLYVITPLMTGVYSIAEVIDDSNKRPDRTVFCFLDEDYVNAINKEGVLRKTFDYAQQKSLDQVGKMVERNGGKYCKTLAEVAEYLNNN